MPKCAFYPIADITFFCWVMLKSHYRNWTYCVSQINTWTVSIHCSSFDSVELLLSRVVTFLKTCKEQSTLTEETLRNAKKRPLKKNYRKHSLSSSQKTKSTQTNGSVFAERPEQVKKTKYERERIKIADRFPYGYGSSGSNLVCFENKSLWADCFLLTKELLKGKVLMQTKLSSQP